MECVLDMFSESVVREAKDQVHLVRFESELFWKPKTTDGVKYSNYPVKFVRFRSQSDNAVRT